MHTKQYINILHNICQPPLSRRPDAKSTMHLVIAPHLRICAATRTGNCAHSTNTCARFSILIIRNFTIQSTLSHSHTIQRISKIIQRKHHSPKCYADSLELNARREFVCLTKWFSVAASWQCHQHKHTCHMCIMSCRMYAYRRCGFCVAWRALSNVDDVFIHKIRVTNHRHNHINCGGWPLPGGTVYSFTRPFEV